jgi:cytochrome c553
MKVITSIKRLFGKDCSQDLQPAPWAQNWSCRIVKIISSQFALPLVVLTFAFSTPYLAVARDSAAISNGAVEAKISYCKDCHGLSAQGYRGFYSIPRLAGQQPMYLENQLRAFVERRRPNPIMSNVAHVLKPAMMTALAAKFRALNPKPVGGAPKRHLAAGRQIFQNGVPDMDIAACAACHGPDASGHEQIPRLAGQLYPYIIKELTNWSKERGQIPGKPDTSAIMGPVAHSLNRQQVEAVAEYLSALK